MNRIIEANLMFPKRKCNNGFTLIEVMIVVAIIGILASIAYPSYIDSVRKARRADAQTTMVEYATFAERIFTESNSYSGATKAASGLTNTDFYTFLPTLTATTFVVTATAINDQTNDPCVNMTLSNTGLTGATGVLGAACWQ
jgi:type IV pilus assembly protein PilE